MSPMTSRALLTGALALLLSACRQDMHDQPRYEPLESSTFFADGRSARQIPPHTVAWGALDDTDSFHTGAANGNYLASVPLPVTIALLHHGQEQFDIYCSPCHGLLGNGDGMVARRGFLNPANLQSERVRSAPPGYLYQVISNGYLAMPDHRDQIQVEDRWAIVAYLRALELSRGATLADVPPAERGQLEEQR